MNPAGETGFITKDIISKYAPKADGAEKVKVSDVQGSHSGARLIRVSCVAVLDLCLWTVSLDRFK
jgi:hypothetical protein